jgi:Ni/Co efflux regulator RcnB
MSVLRKLAGALAAWALVAGFAAPTASAQRGDQIRGERSLTYNRHANKHHDRGHRHQGRRYHDRGHYRKKYRYHDRGRHSRRYDHAYRNRHDSRHRRYAVRPPVHHYGHKSGHGYYNRHAYNRPYYRTQRNYKPRAYYHKPRYVPRYRVGGHYGYGEHSVVIKNYRSHGLYQPPRGYHWVHDRDRGDAILCSVATGAIIGLVAGALSY